MKKHGFTLAEVLISIAIVGVVAAMTIPTLTENTQKQSNEAKEKVCVSDLENAFTMMMVQENATELAETKLWTDANSTVDDQLGKYIKISSLGSVFSSGNCTENANTTCFKTKKEAHVEFTKNSTGASIIIDVNGASKPNKDNVDKFTYTLTADGLLEK